MVIQITDDEKFIHNVDMKLETSVRMGKENIKDIIAFGFDPKKTFIFSDTEYIKQLYPNVIRVQKHTTYSTVCL